MNLSVLEEGTSLIVSRLVSQKSQSLSPLSFMAPTPWFLRLNAFTVAVVTANSRIEDTHDDEHVVIFPTVALKLS